MAPASELSLALAAFDWSAAFQILRHSPDQARRWSLALGFFEGLKDANVLPLHQACRYAAPLPLLVELLQAHPDAVYAAETSYMRLPIHCACRKGAEPAVVEQLLQFEATCPTAVRAAGTQTPACLLPDSLGRLPLHYALSNGADPAVIKILLAAAPEAARGVDSRGWTPLHVAASVGCSPETMELVLRAYPNAIVLQTDKGSSAARILSKTAPHRPVLKQILLRAKHEFDSGFASHLSPSNANTNSSVPPHRPDDSSDNGRLPVDDMVLV